ncbi:hypothetical protein HYU15_04470 [Candidatus Woesearchaeota archaeon]|nr:hypothetical protein [Candidatus Woesearchaeota archaeon]
MPGEEPEGSTCEEALANGVVTEYCSFCGRKEDCPFHLWLFDLKFGDFEMTIQAQTKILRPGKN